MSPQRFTFGPFVLDTNHGALMRDGRPVAAGQKALLLLEAMLSASGQTVTKEQLIDAAWPGVEPLFGRT